MFAVRCDLGVHVCREGSVAPAARSAERLELQNASLRSAAVAMSLIRAVIGFMFFELLFWLRENSYSNVWIGAVIAASSGGVDDRQRTGVTTARTPARGVDADQRDRLDRSSPASGPPCSVASAQPSCWPPSSTLASGVGRMAFDSIVQRDAPDANQGRAFAKFETRFQLSWVVAASHPRAGHVSRARRLLDRWADRCGGSAALRSLIASFATERPGARQVV